MGVSVRAVTRAIRILSAAGALFTGYLCLAAVGLAAWNVPGSGQQQLRAALPALIVAAGLGVLTMLLILAAFNSRKYRWLLLGIAPAVIQAALIFE